MAEDSRITIRTFVRGHNIVNSPGRLQQVTIVTESADFEIEH